MPSIWPNLYKCTYTCALIDAHQLSPSHIGQLSRSEIDSVLRISPCLLNYWDYITLSRFAYLQIAFCRFTFLQIYILYISIFRLTLTAHFDMHLCWYPNFTTSWLVSYPPKVQAFIPQNYTESNIHVAESNIRTYIGLVYTTSAHVWMECCNA